MSLINVQLLVIHFFYCVVLQLSFKMGQSYLVLAHTGLDALEYWSHTLPAHVMQPYYAQILPCLDAYLKTPDTGRLCFISHDLARYYWDIVPWDIVV